MQTVRNTAYPVLSNVAAGGGPLSLLRSQLFKEDLTESNYPPDSSTPEGEPSFTLMQKEYVVPLSHVISCFPLRGKVGQALAWVG